MSIVFGTDSADTLAGGSGAEVFSGRGGNDLIQAGDGDDQIQGDAGNDTLQGAAGNDTIQGFSGDDVLDGGGGVDVLSYLNASGGVTVSLAVSGPQSVGADQGVDTVSNFESLDGSLYPDRLTGDGGANYIRGWSGDDTIQGGAGTDTIEGREGNDSVSGGDGNDFLSGNVGHDTISSGAGSDTIWFNPGDSGVVAGQLDVITDWSNQDTLEFGYVPGGAFLTAVATDYASALDNANYNIAHGNARYEAVQLGSDVVVFADSAGDGGSAEDAVVLRGRALADLSAANFHVYAEPTNPPIVTAPDTTPPVTAPPPVTTPPVTTPPVTSPPVTTPPVTMPLYGTLSSDTIVGGSDADTITAYGGDDSLAGGGGDDVLNAGAGHDTISTGAGTDTLVISQGDSPTGPGQMDVVIDWSSQDRMVFGSQSGGSYVETTASDYASALSTANQLIGHGYHFVAAQIGGDVAVFADTAGNGGVAEDVVMLRGRTLTDISADNVGGSNVPPPVITPPVTSPPVTTPPVITPPVTTPSITSVTMPGLSGYAYDATHGVIYMVSSSGAMESYDVATRTYGPVIQLGGDLRSVAITPDGHYLLAGDHSVALTSSPQAVTPTYADTLYRVDLSTDAVQKLQFAVTGQELGITDVAVAANGAALLTTAFAGSGWNNFRTFDASAASPNFTTTVTGLIQVRQDTYLDTSEDGRLVLIQEANISDAPLHLYDATTGQITHSTDLYAISSSGFNSGLGDVSDAAGLVADVVNNNIYVFSSSLGLVANLTNLYGITGAVAGAQFSQDGADLFLWVPAQQKVLEVDTSNWRLAHTFDVTGTGSLNGLPYSGSMDLIDNGRVLVLANNDGRLELVDLGAGAGGSNAPGGGSATPVTTDPAGVLSGTAGDDTLIGTAGADTINGHDGRNYLRGGDGDDSIAGGSGFDDLNGNMGNDTAHGGAGDDWVVGGRDNDSLTGDGGSDLVYGNLGNDTIDGGDGADIVRGGQGDDVVIGGAGDDFLSGDLGNDTMTGGAGADVFHTFANAGVDRVTDFHLSDGDRVMLDPGTIYTVAQVGADTVINMTGGAQMVLVGVQMTSLTGDWIFGA
jgi:Ca2+-binding RTX toxin-like protein